jgi:ADP-heptose:LPS heptosyltransferase
VIKNVSRILLVRGDKIGDVVLCTPAIEALREKLPEARISMLVRTQVADVLRGNPDLDAVLEIDPIMHSGPKGFLRLVQMLRRERFEVAIVFQAPALIAAAVFLSRIPYRIGPYSKWWSWATYNLGMRQTRSNVEMHEADYNLQLLRDLGVAFSGEERRPKVVVGANEARVAREFFSERVVQNRFKTVAIHPGMAGSALNWPEKNYVRLGRRLLQRYNVVVTGGPSEEALVEKIVESISWRQSFDPEQPVLMKYVGKDTLAHMVAILDRCDGVVAPSTGPMHLAVALKKKVVTVFSPILVQSAIRWGPYGVRHGTNLGVAPQDQASVLVPDVNCAEHFKCALSACIYYPCMPRVSVADVETQLVVLLEGGEVSMFKSTSALLGEPFDIDDDLDDEEIEA